MFISQIEEQKMVVQFELENLEMRPDPEPVLTDMIHAVSYNVAVTFSIFLHKLCCIFYPENSWMLHNCEDLTIFS